MGDFNEILLMGENEGGIPHPQTCMDKFQEALEDSALHDLGFEGDVSTRRNNSHATYGSTWIGLWRTGEWMGRFPGRE